MMILPNYTIFLVPLMSEPFTGLDDLTGLLMSRSRALSPAFSALQLEEELC